MQVFLVPGFIRFRYLYCDEISLKADNVLSTLYAAKKYIMPHLEHACVEYLKKNVSVNNACQMLSDCRLFEETEAIQRCWNVIDNQTTKALQSDSFTDIDYQTLEEVLSRDTLSAKETVIFNAAKRWADAECTRQGRDANSKNCREVLGDALYLLRFSIMTLDEFANGPGQSGLLNTREISDIFFYHTARNKPKLRFPTARRKCPLSPYFENDTDSDDEYLPPYHGRKWCLRTNTNWHSLRIAHYRIDSNYFVFVRCHFRISSQANTNVLKCSKHSYWPCESILFVLRRIAPPNVVSIRVSSYWFVSHRCTFVSIRCTFALGFAACLLRLSTLQYDVQRSYCRIGSHMFALVPISSY